MKKGKWGKSGAFLMVTSWICLASTNAFAAPMELSVAQSVALALGNNPTVKIAAADQQKANWSVTEAQTGKQPNLSFGSNYNFSSSSFDSAGQDNLSNSLRLSLPLYTGGRTEGLIKQAEQGMQNADLAVEKAKQQVKLDATMAYYNVLQAKSLLGVSEQSVHNLQEHLNTVQAKYEAGVVAKSDVLRSEVELANAEQNLLKARNSYDLAVASLINVLGVDSSTEPVLTDLLQYQKIDLTLEQCLELAQNNRPDLAQASINIDIAKTGIDVAESGKLPSLSLSGSTGWNNSLLPKEGNWSVGLSANWSIFDSGLTNAKVKQAESGLAKAEELFTQSLNNALLEVRQNYLSVKEAEKRIETTQTATAKAEEDLHISKERYAAGVGTNLDVIDAQLVLTQAQTNQIQALYDYNVAIAKLDKATGKKAE